MVGFSLIKLRFYTWFFYYYTVIQRSLNHNLKWLNYTVNETRLDHHRPHPIDTKVGIAYSNSMQTHSPMRD